MTTLVLAIAGTLIPALCLAVGWVFGRDRTNYTRGIAKGYWEGRCDNEGERDTLRDQLHALNAEVDNLASALTDLHNTRPAA